MLEPRRDGIILWICVARKARQRARRMGHRIQVARLVAIIDQDDEAAAQAPRDAADPLDRAQVDLRAPSGLELDVEAIEVLGEGRRRQRALAETESGRT